MNKENTKRLLEKYPKIFRQYTLPMNQTCMCWGIECGDGWFDTVDDLCDSIQSYIDYVLWTEPIKNLLYYRAKLNNVVIDYCVPQWLLIYLKRHCNFRYASYDWGTVRPSQIEATQVKEKYGRLRFYTNEADDYIEGMIHAAECRACRTCENCGSRENVTNTARCIITLCKKCRVKREKKIL